MNQPKAIMINMFNKILQSKFRLKTLLFESKLFTKEGESGLGIIYTLYSDKFNLIELGFAKNNKILEAKIKREKFILLDKKHGKKIDLFLIKETLNILGVELFHNNYYKNTNKTLRHLKTLGWPIGNSLYKQKVIRKKISFALN